MSDFKDFVAEMIYTNEEGYDTIAISYRHMKYCRPRYASDLERNVNR